MDFNREKFKALLLYLIWKTGHREGFGSTKLNKTLWFSEARTFQAFGKPIAGETFVRDMFGPRAKHILPILQELVSEGLVEPFTEHVYDYEVTRYRALQPADTALLSAEELSFVDWWVAFIDKHTATSISKFSHDSGWEIAAIGEELPIYAFLASRIREPRSEDEIGWAKSEAERAGLK
jgi:hypothetical protein